MTKNAPSEALVEAMARLSSDNEGLREMLRVVEDPDRQLCCSGHDCGCMGSTVGQYAAWAFRDTAAKDAQLAELRAEVERLRGALFNAAGFAEALADNDPDEQIADNGMTVLDGLKNRAPEVVRLSHAALGSAEG